MKYTQVKKLAGLQKGSNQTMVLGSTMECAGLCNAIHMQSMKYFFILVRLS